jgi:hypothetical protein
MVSQVATLVDSAYKQFEPLESADNRYFFKSHLSQNPSMGERRDSNHQLDLIDKFFVISEIGHLAFHCCDELDNDSCDITIPN